MLTSAAEDLHAVVPAAAVFPTGPSVSWPALVFAAKIQKYFLHLEVPTLNSRVPDKT